MAHNKKTRSIRRTCTGLLSVTDGPQRYLCLDGVKWDPHPGLAPGKIGFADRQLVDFAMCVIGIGQVRGTCTHPAGFTGLNAASYIITWKTILRPESHRHRLLYERSAFLA